jgi:hypothetical protein
MRRCGSGERERANELWAKGPLYLPSSIGEVGWEFFIIFPDGACIYKIVSMGYKWVLNILKLTPTRFILRFKHIFSPCCSHINLLDNVPKYP